MPARGNSPIIDGHAHAAGEFWRGEDIVGVLDGLGVEAVILCPGPVNSPRRWWVPNIGRILKRRGLRMLGNRFIRLAVVAGRRQIDIDGGNALVAELAAKFPGRIVQALWVDPDREGLVAELAAKHEAWRFRGIKLHQCFQRFDVDGPGMRQLAGFAADRGLPIFIHLYAKRDVRALVRLAGESPRTMFVVAHLLGIKEFIRAGPGALPNVYYDISPPNLTTIWLVRRAIEAFGAGRVVLGSDTPYGKDNLSAAVDRIRALAIPEADKTLILGGNARRIYGL